MEHSDVIIGIDLGTTNSEVAFISNGKPKVISIDGKKIVPSVISLAADGNILVGQPAVNNELAAPLETIREVKRRMGNDEVINFASSNYTPQMLSSLILKRLKIAAEEVLGHSVNKAVITVPAFFNEQQREATKEAAELAGLEAVRLLNEPTAAAVAYSLGRKKSECCLIYDLGGGTFDVSIVQISEGIMEVKASHGDVELGGADFDLIIANRAKNAFKEENGIDLSNDPLAWARVLRASEAAKIRLSTEATAEIFEEFITTKEGVALHLKCTITRTEFESMILPTLERTLTSVRMAMKIAETSQEKIDRVILVGGATYTPLVSQLLTSELNIVPQAWLDPSMVVAVGAAIEAANMVGLEIGPTLVDITPHSIGTGCINSQGMYFNHILIHRNTPLPCTASRIFYKQIEFQTKIQMTVYQGESQNPEHNKDLGTFELDDLNTEGRDICVSYTIDKSGILHLTVTDISSGKQLIQTLQRVADSRVKKANLQDMSSVQIKVDENFEAEGFLGEVSIGDESSDDEFEFVSIDNEEMNDETLVNVLDELIKKTETLLSDNKLEEADVKQLTEELVLVKAGDKDAYERLNDLVYFLD